MENNILYLECFSGISGDMTVAALLDLGGDEQVLRHALESLNLPDYKIAIGRRKKCGIDACSFDVHLTAEQNRPHQHSHQYHEKHQHQHTHNEQHHHHTQQQHSHTHSDDENHSHAHIHEHRNIKDIYKIIDRLDSSERAKSLARRMFDIVAEAEAKAHGIPLVKVHFHEVGAIDSIIDIISVAVLIDNLDIHEVAVSPLYEGSGHVRCQHGVIPVPVPAVVNITANHGLPLKLTDNDGEMVTPTGAAIAAALKTRELPASYQIVRVGLGAGQKDFKRANLLRAMLLSDADISEDNVWVLESNIDDCNGEALGYTSKKLFKAGAKDVYQIPAFMKKNRPATILGVICDEADITILENIIFTHTTTVGIRKYPVKRRILNRELKEIETDFGKAVVKVCYHDDNIYYYPEYESVKSLCNKHDLPFQTVYQMIVAAAQEGEV